MTWTLDRIALVIGILAFAVAGVAGVYYVQHPTNQPPATLSQQQISEVLNAHQSEMLHNPEDPVLGNPDGDVTLVEFFDYACTYCKAMHPTVMQMLKDDPKLRYVAKEYPILGPVSAFAAEAALAALKQGKYQDFSSALMTARGLTKDTVFSIAQDVGLDPVQLKSDMATFKDEINAVLDLNFALAKALALKGTPAFIAGRTLIAGAPSAAGLKALVERARSDDQRLAR